MSLSAELLQLLTRHYVKPGAGLAGGVLIPEVGLNDAGPQRRCDAVYVGFTSTSGQLLVGHEIKVSRADWRRELDQPDKASVWSDQCHAWYVVAPSTAVVPVEELPPGWGLMIPSRRSSTRMTTVVKAIAKPLDHRPSWLIVRSAIARLDTLQSLERHRIRAEAKEQLRGEYEGQIATLLARQASARDTEILDQLEQTLGVQLRGARQASRRWVTPDTLTQALRLIDARSALQGWQGAAAQAAQLEQTAAVLRNLDDSLTHLFPAPAGHDTPVA